MSSHIKSVWSASLLLTLSVESVWAKILQTKFYNSWANCKDGFLTLRLIVFVYHYFLVTFFFYFCSIYSSALRTRNFYWSKQYEHWSHWRIQSGGQGWDPPPPHLKNHKNIGFLSNTGLDPLKNHKATKPALNVGPLLAHQRNAI